MALMPARRPSWAMNTPPTPAPSYSAPPAVPRASPGVTVDPYARTGSRGTTGAPGAVRERASIETPYRSRLSSTGIEGVFGQFRDAATRAPGAGSGAGTDAANPYGTESGNTYLEDRYLNRMSGEDLAYNYAAKRGMEGLGNQYAAAGMANSGAARQGESDFLANLTAQSQGQLDSLAAGATGARQRKTDSMFNTALGLAGGEAGSVSPYALGAAGAMSAADQAYIYMLLNKAGVEGQARQGGLNALFNFGKFAAGRPGT